jgi:hypothetical protein
VDALDLARWQFGITTVPPYTMVVRVLASAADGPSSWDLSCDIREHLVDFLVRQHPDALPRPEIALLPVDQPIGVDPRPDGEAARPSPASRLGRQ